MGTPDHDPRYLSPVTLDEALARLSAPGAAALGGGTWILRAPLRHEPGPECLIALAGIAGLRDLTVSGDVLRLGAALTHHDLATRLPARPDLHGLITAAGKSANPGVRRLATLGGNLCTADFAASDLAPALLALDAAITLQDLGGRETLPVAVFLAQRRDRPGTWLMTGAEARLSGRLSAHERLPMRKAGDYPAAIVSLSAEVDPTGALRDARIAVGAVEAAPRRWSGLEVAVEGRPLDPEALEQLARAHTAEFTPREAPDAPGWYRVSVLPALVRRAFATLRSQIHAG